MIRLHVITEGFSEKEMVQKILVPHLSPIGIYADAVCVLWSRDNKTSSYRGGLT